MSFFTVEEHEIVEAMRFSFERLKIATEPSCAVALAPVLRREPALRDKQIGVLINGGNVDLSAFFSTFLREGESAP